MDLVLTWQHDDPVRRLLRTTELWFVPAPAGSGVNANNWVRIDESAFGGRRVDHHPDSILMGFGVEGVSTARQRAAVMGRAMEHLLR